MAIRPLPPPDAAVIDPRTGLMTRDWYDYFRDQNQLVASHTTSIASINALLAAAGVSASRPIQRWFFGTGVPSNAIGIDGDFYLRLTGGTITQFYNKSGGVWL